MDWRRAAVAAVIIVSACTVERGAAPVDIARIEAIGCMRPQPRRGVGTVVADGLLLTAAHVVEGDLRSLEIDGEPATVVGLDVRSDLALVARIDRVPNSPNGTPTWREVRTDVGPGPARILTIDGSIPTEVNRLLTLRVEDVSEATTSERSALELATLVDPGDSGAPVIDADGGLIGVVVLRRPSDDVSYASRIPDLTDLLDRTLYGHPLAQPGQCP